MKSLKLSAGAIRTAGELLKRGTPRSRSRMMSSAAMSMARSASAAGRSEVLHEARMVVERQRPQPLPPHAQSQIGEPVVMREIGGLAAEGIDDGISLTMLLGLSTTGSRSDPDQRMSR
jgi:hypothetical protein